MISRWESELNKRPIAVGGIQMNLGSIFSSVSKKDKVFELNAEFPTIRYIDETEYKNDVYQYVEPNFNESCVKDNAKFILFSAPGATGKTALAKHVCHEYNGMYWELPDSKVAEYSFQGAIMEAVGSHKVSEFIESLKDGRNFLVIDAFDEAEAGSGRTGIEFFLRDLNNVTSGSNNICAVLLARTESAIFIKHYLVNNNIPFRHYEVGYFAEYNAKTYIRNGIERLHIPVTDIVNDCIEAQFKEIKRILQDVNTEDFLGYAPVLNALSASYDESRNTLNLLRDTYNSESNCHLLKKILDDLLIRERKKFIKALQVKLPKLPQYDPEIYDSDEQLLRIFGKIAYDDETIFASVPKSIPDEFHDEYLEVVAVQLPQHPFIKGVERLTGAFYDFTGTAFRDYVIAYILASEETDEFARDYISTYRKYCPSQLLIEFYNIFSGGRLHGANIPLMYNSFKAHAQLEDKITIYLNGDSDDCSIEFRLENSHEPLCLEFDIIDLEKGIYINQLSNSYIDVAGKVYIGNSTGEARINNSIINCDEIIWRSDHVAIEAYSPGESSLITKSMSYTTATLPRFEVKTDDKRNLKVICPSLGGYFKLYPYRIEDSQVDVLNDFISFANLVRRVFSCLRSHGKDAPARKMDFIDNRIISLSVYKESILKFLLVKGILYTDEQDWLYKLETDKLSIYNIKWHDVRDGNYESLKSLYEVYLQEVSSCSDAVKTTNLFT